MQYGEADLQGRDFAKQVRARVTGQQWAHTTAHTASSRELSKQAAYVKQRKVLDRAGWGDRDSTRGVSRKHSCSSAHTQGVTRPLPLPSSAPTLPSVSVPQKNLSCSNFFAYRQSPRPTSPSLTVHCLAPYTICM